MNGEEKGYQKMKMLSELNEWPEKSGALNYVCIIRRPVALLKVYALGARTSLYGLPALYNHY